MNGRKLVKLPQKPLKWLGLRVEYRNKSAELFDAYGVQSSRVVSVVVDLSGDYSLGFEAEGGGVEYLPLSQVEILGVLRA